MYIYIYIYIYIYMYYIIYIYIYIYNIYISECTVVLYVGMARKKKGRPYISIASGKLKSLLIYTYKLKYTYNL